MHTTSLARAPMEDKTRQNSRNFIFFSFFSYKEQQQAERTAQKNQTSTHDWKKKHWCFEDLPQIFLCWQVNFLMSGSSLPFPTLISGQTNSKQKTNSSTVILSYLLGPASPNSRGGYDFGGSGSRDSFSKRTSTKSPTLPPARYACSPLSHLVHLKKQRFLNAQCYTA